MATVFSHVVAGIAISTLAEARGVRRRLAVAAALCAAAPDVDVVTLWLGVPWGPLFGHRGITHSLAFAAVLAAVVTLAAFHGRGRAAIWLALFVATASHGVLDAMTDGGSGVALFAPLDDTRYFLPWRPIPVSPIGSRFFTQRGLDILKTELWQIWLPAGIVALIGLWRRGGR